MNSKRISLTDTAKLIRETLKTEFAGIKFSVRSKSYSGGSSIDIRWTDGPTSKQVNAFTSMFEGATFDGMIDLKSYVDIINEDGEKIHYGVDFVFENREYSDELTQKVAELAAHYYGMETPVMNDRGWYDRGVNNYPVSAHCYETLSDIISQWRQYAVWHNGEIEFITIENQIMPGDLEMLIEHPGIQLAESCYHPRRIEFEAAQKANEAKAATVEPAPVVATIEQPTEVAPEVIAAIEPAQVIEASPVIAKLQSIDLLNITPLDALNLLAELKRMAS